MKISCKYDKYVHKNINMQKHRKISKIAFSLSLNGGGVNCRLYSDSEKNPKKNLKKYKKMSVFFQIFFRFSYIFLHLYNYV